MDDQALGLFANVVGILVFLMTIAYHYVLAEPKYASN